MQKQTVQFSYQVFASLDALSIHDQALFVKAQEALVYSLNRELAVMKTRSNSETELFQQRLKIAQEEAKLEEQRLAILSESEDGYAAQQKAALDASNNIVLTKEQENILLDWRNSPSTWTGK